MFRWRDSTEGIGRAVTDRHGGYSAEPFASLNLGGSVGDDPAAVSANRSTVAAALGLPSPRLVFMRQCHGAGVEVIDGPWSGEPPECDALVTAAADVALAALAADCVPILLMDRDAGVIAAVHAGREGLAAGVVSAALAAMAGLGAGVDVPGQVQALVGPSICGDCYEVPEPMQEQVARVVPQARARSLRGSAALDIGAGVVAQLTQAGAQVRRLPGCTREATDLYSHRGAGGRPTGRFAAIVVRYAAPGPRAGHPPTGLHGVAP